MGEIISKKNGNVDNIINPLSQDIVTDVNLRIVLNKILSTKELERNNCETITISDMESLQGPLDLGSITTGVKIKCIDGLQYAKNITQLYLDGNEILDISPIYPLINLTWLQINDNSIISIENIGYLSNLEGLDISNNKLNSLGSIDKLFNLEVLRLSNVAESLSEEELKKLRNITSIFTLDISRNGIYRIIADEGESLLPNSINIMSLDISNNKIQSINGLKIFNNLKILSLCNNNQLVVDAVGELLMLERLDLSGIYNTIDLTVLIKLSNLIELDLSNSKFINLSALMYLSKLSILSLSNSIDGLEGVEIPKLVDGGELIINNAEITSIRSLEKNEGLLALHLNNNSIKDIELLKEFYNLKILEIENNNIENINILSNLSNLNVLTLNNNSISDITPLVSNEKLIDAQINNQKIILKPLKIDTNNQILIDLNGILKNRKGNIPKYIYNIFPKGKGSLNGNMVIWDNIIPTERLSFEFKDDITFSGLVIQPVIINIPDSKLKLQLNKRISYITKSIRDNDSEITIMDMELIKGFLDLSNKGIRILEGLRYAKNIIGLSIENNEVEDVTEIAMLENLIALNLNLNKISILPNMSPLTRLEVLLINNNSISDLYSVNENIAIERLDISNNNIYDIKAIQTLVGLKEINIRNNKVVEVISIAQLIANQILMESKLRILDISCNLIYDLSPLKEYNGILITKG